MSTRGRAVWTREHALWWIGLAVGLGAILGIWAIHVEAELAQVRADLEVLELERDRPVMKPAPSPSPTPRPPAPVVPWVYCVDQSSLHYVAPPEWTTQTNATVTLEWRPVGSVTGTILY